MILLLSNSVASQSLTLHHRHSPWRKFAVVQWIVADWVWLFGP